MMMMMTDQSHEASARAIIAVLLLLAGSVCPLSAQTQADTESAGTSVDPPQLFSPTLGRPVFVAPGESFQVATNLPPAPAGVKFSLVYARDSRQCYRLEPAENAAAALGQGQPFELRVPPDVPPRTYDLEIRSGQHVLRGRHCVAVGVVGEFVRIVHLSNLNLGDPGAMTFDDGLIDEINLVAPTLIVATGDYLDALHPNPEQGWQTLVDVLTKFNAPILMACGEHDDIAFYSKYVSPSPIGVVNVGRHRCVILYDHMRAPIEQDAEQLRWLDTLLGRRDFASLTFIVTHSDYPNLLEYWRRNGVLGNRVRTGRLALWFVGGHTDWDNRSYRSLLDEAHPLVYLRTHQSSHAPREGASGISHYRIVDVADNCVILPETRLGQERVPPSTPRGYLSASCEGRSDGSETTLAVSVVNNLPYRLNKLTQWVRLRKIPGGEPWCQGGQLEEVIDLGTCWECALRLSAPDKGSVLAIAGSGPQPATPRIAVQFQTDDTLVFEPRTTAADVSFAALASQAPVVHLTNAGEEPVAISPLIRLDGNPISYRPAEGNATFATAYRLNLPPGDGISLQLDLSAATVGAGRRELQVYLRGLTAVVPYCQPVRVVVTQPRDVVPASPVGR